MTSSDPTWTEEAQETAHPARSRQRDVASPGQGPSPAARDKRLQDGRGGRRTWPTIGVLAAAAVVLGGGAAYLLLGDSPGASAARSPPQVAVAEAATAVWTGRVETAGGLRAIRRIDVAATVPGKIVDIGFQSGAQVKAGALLARLDTAEEEAALAATEARLAQARLDAARALKLYERGAGAEAAANAEASNVERLEADAARQRATIAKKRIEAPFDGVLGIRQTDFGAYVAPGQPIVSLQQTSPIHVRYSLPERHFAEVAPGQTVEVAVDAFPGETFDGEISEIEPAVDEATRTFVVQATLPNEDRRLAPGMYADVATALDEEREVITVPATAIAYNAYGAAVYLIRDAEAYRSERQARAEAASAVAGARRDAGDGWLDRATSAIAGLFNGADDAGARTSSDAAPSKVAQRRFVETGERRGLDIEIVEGLDAGDRVVTAGQMKLSDGRPVRIVDQDAFEAAEPRPTSP